jgi:hypothetical protein
MPFKPSSFRLGPKIGLSIALFGLPIALILYLLVSAQNKDIGFATQEVEGTRALGVLAQIQASTDHALLSGARPAGTLSTNTGAADAFATIGLADEAKALAGSLRDVTDAATATVFRTPLRDLQGKVGDHSNLILDNVLETFYLTDVVLNRLPDLLDRLTDIGPLAAAQATSPDDRATFLINLGALGTLLEGMDASMQSAIEDDVSGVLKTTLMPEYTGLHRDLVDLRERLKLSADAKGAAELLDRGIAFTRSANDKLNDALRERVTHLQNVQRLAFVATLLLFALAASGTMLVIRNGVIRPVNALCVVTRRLADGDYEAVVPERKSAMRSPTSHTTSLVSVSA